MRVALEAAADDAGARSLLDRATDTWVVKGAWPYPDPAALLRDEFGNNSRTGISTDGGTPQSLVNKASLRIQSGEADVVLIVGAEEFGVVEGPQSGRTDSLHRTSRRRTGRTWART